MNPTFTLRKGRLAYLLCLLVLQLHVTLIAAQDVSIAITSQRAGANNETWPYGATDCTILMTLCNNDGGSTPVPEYKLMPVLNIGTGYAQIAPDDQQTGLPPGWTILSNDGASIRLSNGTDTWAGGECREISIKIIPISIGGPDQFGASLEFADGNAPGDIPGGPTVDNDPNNDYGEATATIVNILPVTLTAFNAVHENGAALLSWTTAPDASAAWFEAEHSADGYNWTVLQRIAANTAGRYQYRHNGMAAGRHYFRLKMAGRSGDISFSPVRLLRAATAGNSFVYPNPAAGQFNITAQQAGTAFITSLTGRRLATLQLQPGTNTVDVSAFSAGVYFIAVYHNGGVPEIHRVLVQH